MADWNSNQYLKFKKERTRPAGDLLNAVEIDSPNRVLDIGCGPGNSTALLKSRFKNSYILGVDSSENMISHAKKDNPDIDFKLFDANGDFSVLGDKFDLIFSNACIQWIPNHSTLIPKMMDALKVGGTFAVQIPVQNESVMHNAVAELCKTDKWNKKFAYKNKLNLLSDSEYYNILAKNSSDFTMWKTIYYHRMPSVESIVEFYRSTALKPYLEQLDENDKADFEREIIEFIKPYYPSQENSEIIFKFPRLFITAKK